MAQDSPQEKCNKSFCGGILVKKKKAISQRLFFYLLLYTKEERRGEKKEGVVVGDVPGSYPLSDEGESKGCVV